MPAEMAGMTNDAETAGPLGSTLNDGRKSALRAPASRGLEVRVRPVRRRSWPDADKLRMVRGAKHCFAPRAWRGGAGGC